jgi:DNA-binding CsgD family transcriptional regulator
MQPARHPGWARLGNRGAARLTGAESLAPGELGVARLAAEGRANRQIARALFIITKTAGTHLGHIYGKPGTGNRGRPGRIMREASGRHSKSEREPGNGRV